MTIDYSLFLSATDSNPFHAGEAYVICYLCNQRGLTKSWSEACAIPCARRVLRANILVAALLRMCSTCWLNFNEELTRSSADADNRLDAFSVQSRSTNIVPFHILGMVSYCTVVTLSFRRALFTIFVSWPWNRVRGHSMSLKVATFDRLCMVPYQCFLVTP